MPTAAEGRQRLARQAGRAVLPSGSSVYSNGTSRCTRRSIDPLYAELPKPPPPLEELEDFDAAEALEETKQELVEYLDESLFMLEKRLHEKIEDEVQDMGTKLLRVEERLLASAPISQHELEAYLDGKFEALERTITARLARVSDEVAQIAREVAQIVMTTSAQTLPPMRKCAPSSLEDSLAFSRLQPGLECSFCNTPPLKVPQAADEHVTTATDAVKK